MSALNKSSMLPGNTTGSIDTKRYDRQLRIWGDHGQLAVAQAKVCLVGATATGTEILKNLILPGIGSFTIIDNEVVTEADLGNNFFLVESSVGRPRALEVTEHLLELNEDVQGHYLVEDPATLLKNDPKAFHAFTLVIASGTLHESTLLALDGVLAEQGIPLLHVYAYGLLGYIRLVSPAHYVFEPHPDNQHADLRLDCPFPDLQKMCDEVNLEHLPDDQHRHVPYALVLLHYLNKWRETHEGRLPSSTAEQRELKALIQQGKRRKAGDSEFDEENFDEAIKNVRQAWYKTQVPPHVSEMFGRPEAQRLTRESSEAHIIVRALADFVSNEGEGRLPVRGTLPDMEADSETYTCLQHIYVRRAAADCAAVRARVQAILTEVGRKSDSISDLTIRLACKNASYLRVVDNRLLVDEVHATTPTAMVQEMAGDPNNRALSIYLSLLAAQRCRTQYGRHPGAVADAIDHDAAILRTQAMRICQAMGLPYQPQDDWINEICRYGGLELHNIASLLGGMAAQEAIKLITHQFVPLNNTLIYDGIEGRVDVFQA